MIQRPDQVHQQIPKQIWSYFHEDFWSFSAVPCNLQIVRRIPICKTHFLVCYQYEQPAAISSRTACIMINCINHEQPLNLTVQASTRVLRTYSYKQTYKYLYACIEQRRTYMYLQVTHICNQSQNHSSSSNSSSSNSSNRGSQSSDKAFALEFVLD